MKRIKRFSLLALAALMLIGVIACNRGADGSRRQGRAAQVRWPGPEPRDLGGMVFKIADFDQHRFFPSPAEIGTPLGDAKLAVMESIQDDFNITFEIIRVTENDILDRLSPAVWAGDMFAHVVITTKWAYGWLIGAGLMGDLSAIPTLDLNNGQWEQAIHRVTTLRGEVLATAGIFENWDRIWAVFFNKSLWQDLNLPDPYEMVRRGEWTWDRLQEYAAIAQEDLTGDGVVDSPNDRWGLVATPDDLLRSWYASMGGRFFDFNPATGRLYLSMATPDGIAIANWMRAFSDVPGLLHRGVGQTTADRISMFVNRRALFYPQGLLLLPQISAMDDDIGMLPFPKRNALQQTYLTPLSHNASLIGITKPNDQLEATGIIMEAMAARFAPVRELQMAELEDIILRSDEDVEMLDYILPYTVYDLGHIMPRAGGMWSVPMARLSQYVTYHTVSDFAAEMEANRDAIEILANEVFFGE